MSNIFLSVFFMFVFRLGSLNALEQSINKNRKYWEALIGGRKGSPEAIGYALNRCSLDSLRTILRQVAHAAKRRKALRRHHFHGGRWVAAIDGHEVNASRKRCCEQCSVRELKTNEGIVLEYYHRVVVLQMVDVNPPMILDVEPIMPGEGEVAAAMRILDRIAKHYRRFLDVITADALYLQAPFVKRALEHGLHLVIVLKQEERDLYKDVHGLLKVTKPICIEEDCRSNSQLWDIEGLETWKQVGLPVRVVRSFETKRKRERIGRKWVEKTMISDWLWVTTLSASQAPCNLIVRWGHARWDIENRGFNELSQHWAMDHFFYHELNAIVAFLLILALAFVLTIFFFDRNLKPQARKGCTRLFLASQLLKGLSGLPFPVRAP